MKEWHKKRRKLMDNKEFINVPIGENLCFVCGKELDLKNQTVEHIFPKWLQRRFNLWDKYLILLNDTKIPYKYLTIPCCRNCNKDLNDIIEKPMKKIFEDGCQNISENDRKIIYMWINKIQYGILYKETLLSFNRSKQDGLNIYPKEILEGHYLKYAVLLSSVQNNMIGIDYPGSLFVFQILNKNNHFNFTDRLEFSSTYIIMGGIGIIAHFSDGGILKSFFDENGYLNKFINYKLHPIQFNEICGKILYQQFRMGDYLPYYMYAFDFDENKINTIQCYNSPYVPFLEWNLDDYVNHVFLFVKYYNPDLQFPSDLKDEAGYLTYLEDINGNFVNFEFLDN